MNKKEYGLVLSGGGTRGAFQVGVWKALKELGIDVKAIAGTSIGALNGALFLQDDFNTTVKLYERIKIDNIMKLEGVNANKNIFDLSNILNVASNYKKQKGIDNTPLREMIKQYIDMDKLYNSDIDFGLVSYSVRNKTPLQKFKNEIPKEQMEDYLLASACFPIFKPQVIDGEEYFDGGLYDNTPSNMLIRKGYKNIIIVDMAGMGFNRKSAKRDSYIKVITPSEDLGGSFEFNHSKIINNIKMGYLDTMKSFNKLQGHMYYFKPEEFAKMLEKFNLQTIYGLEYAAEMYKMYKYREYTFEEFITELMNRHLEAEQIFEKMKKENLIQIGKRLNKLFDKGLGICIAKDLYMDRPASRLSNYLFNFVKDYIVAAKALIELKNYMG
ncbi:MAG: patatin-like phospholipase family protein [Clostridia bacterium]|nr:patatin-like phospholipase family protein [Clostridia bacterium]